MKVIQANKFSEMHFTWGSVIYKMYKNHVEAVSY